MKIYVKLIQTISKSIWGFLCLTCRCFGNHILDSWVKQKMVSVLLCTGSQWWIFSKKHQETAHDSHFHSNVDKPNNEPPILGGLDSVRPPISGEILLLMCSGYISRHLQFNTSRCITTGPPRLHTFLTRCSQIDRQWDAPPMGISQDFPAKIR